MTGKLESIKEAMGHALAIDNFDLRVDGNMALGTAIAIFVGRLCFSR
jgi:hypothetical protein